jgi:hypothetical protein
VVDRAFAILLVSASLCSAIGWVEPLDCYRNYGKCFVKCWSAPRRGGLISRGRRGLLVRLAGNASGCVCGMNLGVAEAAGTGVDEPGVEGLCARGVQVLVPLWADGCCGWGGRGTFLPCKEAIRDSGCRVLTVGGGDGGGSAFGQLPFCLVTLRFQSGRWSFPHHRGRGRRG